MSGNVNTQAPPESYLYTFVDEAREFALYFLEGQRLIYELALLHPIRKAGFAYFRDVVLSVQPMTALLKHGEQFGFYIDSAEPFFRLKIETSQSGATRCTLFPEEFQEFPAAMKGLVRLLKLFPNNVAPYESVLEVEALPLGEIVNRVLAESYQVHAGIVVSQESDQSVMLLRLPPPTSDDEDSQSPVDVDPRRRAMEQDLERIFARGLHEPEEIGSAFGEIGFELLARRQICFRCSCSPGRMIEGIRLAVDGDFEGLFDPDQHALEITCEYCKNRYSVTREDLRQAPNPIN
jgi:molecular chaperone Hsp33